MDQFTEAMNSSKVNTKDRKRKRESGNTSLFFGDNHVPLDVLASIASKFSSLEDYIRFGAVCRLWQSAAAAAATAPEGLSPWLRLAVVESPETNDVHSQFYSLGGGGGGGGGELFQFHNPELEDAQCWGSPFGWLVSCNVNTELQLFNPLSNASIFFRFPAIFCYAQCGQIKLCPLYWARYFMNKLILTAHPASPTCLVFMIYSDKRRLGFIIPEIGRRWSPVEGDQWDDITCFQGNYFGCRRDGQVMILNIETGGVELFANPPPPPAGTNRDGKSSNTYLVDLGGELGLVFRYRKVIVEGNYYATSEFEVYRMDTSIKEWTRVSWLDRCLFLGTNYSYSVQPRGHLRPNCIYFSDDFSDFRTLPYDTEIIDDIGMYDLGKNQVERFTGGPDSLSIESSYKCLFSCTSVWFTPSLH